MAGVEAWRVFGTIGLDGLGKTTGELRAFNALGTKVGANVLGLNKKMLLLAGGAAAAAGAVALVGGKSVKAFASFDEAMTESLAIMGDVSEALEDDMVAAARRVARETLFTADQAAESYFFLASAGLSAQQSIAALPQVAAFAQAGMFDMATATDLATDAQSALGLTVDDSAQNLENLTRVTDVLVKANTLANATVEQFSTALTSDAGAAAKAFGVSLEETVSVLAAYADQGVKAEKAGSAFGRLLRLLVPAANKNAAAYEKLGVTVFDTEGNLRSMADILVDLEKALLNVSVQERSARLEMLGFQKRTQQVVLPLLGMAEAVREYGSDLDEAGGITREVADNQLQTLNRQLDLLASEFRDVALEMGEFIVETTNLPDAVREITRFIRVVRFDIGKLLETRREALAEADLDIMAKLFPETTMDTTVALLRSINEEVDKAKGSADEVEPLVRPDAPTPPAGFGRFEPRLGPIARAQSQEIMDLLASPVGIDDEAAWNRVTEIMERNWGQAVGEGFVPIKDPEIESQVTDPLSELLRNSADAVREQAKQTFERLGEDLILGLIAGTFNKRDFLKTSFLLVMRNFVLTPLFGALGIASPSRVTMDMGRQMVLGLEQGIRETARQGGVASAWASVVGGLPSMAAASGSLSPSMGLDLSGMPPARNPLAAARDRDWQIFLRAGISAARKDGFQE